MNILSDWLNIAVFFVNIAKLQIRFTQKINDH